MNITWLEHLKIIGDFIISSPFSIVGLVITLIVMLLFMTTNKSNQMKSKKFYRIIYIVFLIAILFQYHKSLGNMLDYLINHIFILIYFPNLAVYLIAIIVSNIVMWRSMFNGKTDKKIKWINSVCFSGIHYFLIVLLQVISDKKLDVFSQTSIYSNQEAFSLIELSSIIFIGWMLFLLLYVGIKKYLNKKNKVVVELPKQNEKTENTLQNSSIRQISEKSDYEFTLEEYRLLSKILKEERQKIIEEEQEKHLLELERLYQTLD